MKRREELTIIERLYIWEVIKGVFLTTSKLVYNLSIFLLNCVGLAKEKRPWATIEYPDDIRLYPPRFRGRHRLTLNERGEIKCTACFLCATACPARCIHIVPQEHPDKTIEKIPGRYEIDTLLCVYCGYCVEACPVDAIRMDTGIHPEIYAPDPRAYVEDRELLLERSRMLENKPPRNLLQEHLAKIRQIEKHPLSADT